MTPSSQVMPELVLMTNVDSTRCVKSNQFKLVNLTGPAELEIDSTLVKGGSCIFPVTQGRSRKNI